MMVVEMMVVVVEMMMMVVVVVVEMMMMVVVVETVVVVEMVVVVVEMVVVEQVVVVVETPNLTGVGTRSQELDRQLDATLKIYTKRERPTAKALVSVVAGGGEEAAATLVRQLTGVVRTPRGPDGTRGFTMKR
ncbi:unnamed protein product [Lampetra planeri]